RNELDMVATGVDVPLPPGADRPRQRVHAALPARVEYRLVPLDADRSHALHAAHVVRAVHLAPSARGMVTFPTPLMDSRVTRPASASSLRFSLPVGRSGTMR